MTLVRVMKLCLVFRHTGSVYYYTVSLAWWSVEWGQTSLICVSQQVCTTSLTLVVKWLSSVCSNKPITSVMTSLARVTSAPPPYHVYRYVLQVCTQCVQVCATGVLQVCSVFLETFYDVLRKTLYLSNVSIVKTSQENLGYFLRKYLVKCQPWPRRFLIDPCSPATLLHLPIWNQTHFVIPRWQRWQNVIYEQKL